jgi:ABC-type transport system substrate-binding protein
MLDPQVLVERLGGDAAPLPGFVLDDFWQDKELSVPCSGATEEQRLTQAVNILKNAGYSWSREPALDVDASGLKTPEGDEIPRLSLLTPQDDLMRDVAAKYIAQQAKILGLLLDVQIRNADDLLYDVYGSRDYDMALLGWRLSAYPSYLCEWFVPSEQNPFAYSGSNLMSGCDAWAQVTDLEMAKIHAFEVQSVLMQDLPLIPLYVQVRYDAYRNVRFPFSDVTDGLTGLYGAPALAEPIP